MRLVLVILGQGMNFELAKAASSEKFLLRAPVSRGK
jgi:hypothetical protein